MDQLAPSLVERDAWLVDCPTATQVVPLAAIEDQSGVTSRLTEDHVTPPSVERSAWFVPPKAIATKVLPLAATSNHVLVFAIVTADHVAPLSVDRAAWFELSATATQMSPLTATEE